MRVIKLFLASAGGLFLAYLGGFDSYLKTLLIFMAIDYVLGITLGFLGKSKNSERGGLSSYIGWVGIIKKIAYLTLVIIAIELDMLLGLSIVRNATIIFFILNELISITENFGLLGIKIPAIITKAIDILENREEEKNDRL